MSFKRGQLRYFLTVAEEGQITRAATRLHIAQPALSHAIAQLESDLGVELLERHARGVSLTPAGEAFLPKARAAVASEAEAERTAKSLARAATGLLEVGFVGPPPVISSPNLFAAFAEAHPDAELSLRDLPFPQGDTGSWLEDVDVAFCHTPALEAEVEVLPVSLVPRALVVGAKHPLAARSEVAVADVLDETFVGYHPSVQPEWAGFHSLDDHRGGPPAALTTDRALSSLQMLGIMATGAAVTTVPIIDGRLAQQALPTISVIPVHDARPAVMSLVWRSANPSPLVQALAATAERLGLDGTEALVAYGAGSAREEVAPLQAVEQGNGARPSGAKDA